MNISLEHPLPPPPTHTHTHTKKKKKKKPKKSGLHQRHTAQHRILGAGPDIMWSANTACPHAYSHIIGPFNTTFQSMPQGLIYSGSHLCLNTPVSRDGKFMVGNAGLILQPMACTKHKFPLMQTGTFERK